MTWWCEHAWLGGDTVASGVVIEADGERISRVETGVAEPPPGSTRLFGLTIPALANAHSHAFHRALRGRTHADRGTFWTWRDLMYKVAARLDPDSYFDLARGVFGEMTMAGIGAVGEFHYVHHQPEGTPYADANALGEALVAAATEVGIRITLLDTLYLHGGFAKEGAEIYEPLAPEQIRFSDGSANAWAQRVDQLAVTGSLAAVGAAIHSVRAVDPASMQVVRDWAASADAPLHIHVSEQPAENEQCRIRHSCTPIELLDSHGVLGDRTTLVHATHLARGDIGKLASSGSCCCFCPTTERDLADGIGPSLGLAEAGIPISLGSDSHAVIDLFEEARAVELDQRLASLERGTHNASELMAMATEKGYRSLGWADGGHIAVGALADFTTIRLDTVRLAGVDVASMLGAAVFAATAADVCHVVVAGRAIVNGEHVSLDVERLLADSIGSLLA